MVRYDSAEMARRGRLGALASHGRHDARELTKNARAAFRAQFERQVDPDGVLPEEERQRRAASARRAHYAQMGRMRQRVRTVARDILGACAAEYGRGDCLMDERWSDLVDAERSRQDARWGGYPHDSKHTEEDWNEISERFIRRAFAAGAATDWGGFREALVKAMAVAAARRETALKRIIAAAITARV